MSFKKSWGLGAIAAASLLAVPALAQDRDERIFDADEARRSLTQDLNVSVSGGLSAFTGDLGAETVAGGFLGVQASSRPLPLLGVELGYEGSRNAFEDIDGGLWRHNVGALAKVGPELGVNRNLRPFVGAGVGVSLLNPSETGEVPFDNDVITEVPFAAGVEYDLGGITAGARASYRLLGGENLGAAESGNIVNLGIQVGGAF
ncbi:porin family protein [Archangium minus]|uniref:Porin family protein n=1 Tax=Archangium minus TaxID=83450 RepID=A0ABY9WK64_9BACT|nr:porin family protein [Archangium violaceum]WNG43534.1 porin family protein [Archangium minus]